MEQAPKVPQWLWPATECYLELYHSGPRSMMGGRLPIPGHLAEMWCRRRGMDAPELVCHTVDLVLATDQEVERLKALREVEEA